MIFSWPSQIVFLFPPLACLKKMTPIFRPGKRAAYLLFLFFFIHVLSCCFLIRKTKLFGQRFLQDFLSWISFSKAWLRTCIWRLQNFKRSRKDAIVLNAFSWYQLSGPDVISLRCNTIKLNFGKKLKLLRALIPPHLITVLATDTSGSYVYLIITPGIPPFDSVASFICAALFTSYPRLSTHGLRYTCPSTVAAWRSASPLPPCGSEKSNLSTLTSERLFNLLSTIVQPQWYHAALSCLQYTFCSYGRCSFYVSITSSDLEQLLTCSYTKFRLLKRIQCCCNVLPYLSSLRAPHDHIMFQLGPLGNSCL